MYIVNVYYSQTIGRVSYLYDTLVLNLYELRTRFSTLLRSPGGNMRGTKFILHSLAILLRSLAVLFHSFAIILRGHAIIIAFPRNSILFPRNIIVTASYKCICIQDLRAPEATPLKKNTTLSLVYYCVPSLFIAFPRFTDE